MSRFKDLTGQTFGRLTVKKLEGKGSNGRCYWLCQCNCGKQKTVCTRELQNGKTSSCGCLKAERLINLVGQKFGRLTVLSRVENNTQGATRWLCKCECGNTSFPTSISLRFGGTISCGCYNREISSNRFYKHGKVNTST